MSVGWEHNETDTSELPVVPQEPAPSVPQDHTGAHEHLFVEVDNGYTEKRTLTAGEYTVYDTTLRVDDLGNILFVHRVRRIT